MKEAMANAGLLEPVFVMGGFFSVTFYRPVDFEKWLEGWTDKLSEPLIKILNMMNENPEVTKAEILLITGQSKTSLDRYIEKLRSMKLLTRHGSRKVGYWSLNLNNVSNRGGLG